MDRDLKTKYFIYFSGEKITANGLEYKEIVLVITFLKIRINYINDKKNDTSMSLHSLFKIFIH